MQLGLVGLGRMGSGMLRRLRQRGHDVIGFDPHSSASDVTSLEALVQALSVPRTVWVMVPAGAPTREVIGQLSRMLSRGDRVVDGGNTRFIEDRIHAEILAHADIRLVDCGVSGGVWGEADGYALMVGGHPTDVSDLMPIFEALCPDGERADSFVHAGPLGAGHYAKMVHNGVEYGLMQAYAEGFELLAAEELITDVPAVLRAWSRGFSIFLSTRCPTKTSSPGCRGMWRTPVKAAGRSKKPSVMLSLPPSFPPHCSLGSPPDKAIRRR